MSFPPEADEEDAYISIFQKRCYSGRALSACSNFSLEKWHSLAAAIESRVHSCECANEKDEVFRRALSLKKFSVGKEIH